MNNCNIFELTPEEVSLNITLKNIIIDEINHNNGSILFSRFMELALYHNRYGYYSNLSYKFGKHGDFITAPLVSNLFAKCLVKQINQLWEHIPNQSAILEIGAGNGQLMFDILKECGDSLACYYVLELSPSLTVLQQERLHTELPQVYNKVKWLTELPFGFNGVILANEVLDAQPCELFTVKDSRYYLRHVGYNGDSFVYIDNELKDDDNTELAKNILELPKIGSNYSSEVNLINRGFIKSLSECLATGCIILIDYGYGEDEYYNLKHSGGTLRGFFRQHMLDDVLNYTGLIDITCSVDFTAIAKTAITCGFDIIDYTSQASFLINCGVTEYMEQVKDTGEYLKLSNQINKLTSPNEMGEIFKVIGLSKNIDFYDWVGFKTHSLSHLL